jgi:hypothetical protein
MIPYLPLSSLWSQDNVTLPPATPKQGSHTDMPRMPSNQLDFRNSLKGPECVDMAQVVADLV